MSELSNERLAEQGIEVLRRLSRSKLSLSDASFIAQWATEVRAVLRQSHSTGAVVKGLEWREEFGYAARAESPVGVYAINDFVGFEDRYRLGCPTAGRLLCFTTLSEAKAAAQADYERRILSAIVGSAK